MMAEEDFEEFMNRLEAEPSSSIVPDLTPGPDIPALREQLAVLVSTGKAKEAIGKQLTHEQLKLLTDKDVERYYKRYEAFVGSKTTESMVDILLTLALRGLQMVIEIDDIEGTKKELKEDYIIHKEMTDFVGRLSLKYGKLLAPLSAALITGSTSVWRFLSIPHQLLSIPHQLLNNYRQILSNFICKNIMSTEPHSPGETQTAHSQGNLTQQAKQSAKNPKRVAAGRAIAERTRVVREQQKKAAAEAAVIMANNTTKAAAPAAAPPSTKAWVDLSTTQWIGVASIGVSLLGLYYKREELKAVLGKKSTPEPADTVEHFNLVAPPPPRGLKHLE